MAPDQQRDYGEKQGRRAQERVRIMAPEKDGSRTRRKAGAERGDGGSGRRRVAKKANPSGDVAMVDVDPWGSFFEMFWGSAEGESTDRHDGGQEPAKGARAAGTKPGRRGRSPRAS
jgi:hypothetical protein